MKIIRGLKHKPIVVDDTIEKEKDMPTYRIMFKNMIGKSLAKSGEDSIERYQVGLKLMQDQEIINLEDAEFLLLKSAVTENQSQIAAHYQAQLLLKLNESEKEAEMLKKKQDQEKVDKSSKK